MWTAVLVVVLLLSAASAVDDVAMRLNPTLTKPERLRVLGNTFSAVCAVVMALKIAGWL